MTSLYKRLLGERYAVLPNAVKQLHDYQGSVTYAGTCNVKRGENFIANIFATILALPKAALNVPVTVNFSTDGEKEHWNRRFGNHTFHSIQWQKNGFLYERLNFTTLVFQVDTNAQMLDLVLQRVYVFGIPVIRFLNPRVIARETEVDGKFHFFIQTSLPILGLLVQYEGNLERIP